MVPCAKFKRSVDTSSVDQKDQKRNETFPRVKRIKSLISCSLISRLCFFINNRVRDELKIEIDFENLSTSKSSKHSVYKFITHFFYL